MAIEKVKKTKVEISTTAAIQLGISAVLVILSLIFGYMSLVRWRFKVNLVSGYEKYDVGEVENAKKDLEAALSWDSRHAGARELLAKIQCDINLLDAAETNYNQLLQQGYGPPQVFVGLGVVALKKAERADAKGAEPLLKQARDFFEKAGGIPEASVGLGHCDLLQAERLAAPADPKRYDAAIQRFRKIRDEMNARQDYRASCSRWGMVDYYSGLGKAFSSSAAPEDRRAAAAVFRCWYQQARRSPVPMGNLLVMESRKYEERIFTQQEMAALKAEAQALRRETDLWKRQREAFDSLKEPWLQYTLSLAKAFLEAGMENDYEALVREVSSSSGFQNRLEPFLYDADVRTRKALRDEAAPALDSQILKTSQAYKTLLYQNAIKDESNRSRRARAMNNAAWMDAWLGSYHGNDMKLREAQTQLLEAVKLFPEDYVYNRNLCVVLKRLRRPEREIQPHLEKAKAADKGTLADDFSRFQQYMGGQ